MIREARLGEAGVLAGIQRDASLAALGHIFPPEYPFPLDEVRQRWRDALDDPAATVLVAEEEEGSAVGVAMSRPTWLDGLYVLPAWWGSGVARRLHDEALELVRAAGSDRCHLWVLEGNDRARRFYERCGWRLNGETRVVPFPPHPIDVGYSIDL